MATGHTEFGLMFLSCAQETIEKGLGPTNCTEDAPTLPQGCNKVVHGLLQAGYNVNKLMMSFLWVSHHVTTHIAKVICSSLSLSRCCLE